MGIVLAAIVHLRPNSACQLSIILVSSGPRPGVLVFLSIFLEVRAPATMAQCSLSRIPAPLHPCRTPIGRVLTIALVAGGRAGAAGRVYAWQLPSHSGRECGVRSPGLRDATSACDNCRGTTENSTLSQPILQPSRAHSNALAATAPLQREEEEGGSERTKESPFLSARILTVSGVPGPGRRRGFEAPEADLIKPRLPCCHAFVALFALFAPESLGHRSFRCWNSADR